MIPGSDKAGMRTSFMMETDYVFVHVIKNRVLHGESNL